MSTRHYDIYINITKDTNKDYRLCRNVPKDTRESKTNPVPYGHEVISRMRYERPKDTRYQRYRRAMVRILSLCYQRTEFRKISNGTGYQRYRHQMTVIRSPRDQRYSMTTYHKISIDISIKDTNVEWQLYKALKYHRYQWLSTKRYQTISVSKIPMSNDSYTKS